MRYGWLKSNLEWKVSLSIGFGKLMGRLIGRDGDRRILQRSQEIRQDGINRNLPTITGGEGNGERKNWRFRRKRLNSGDLELAQEGQSGTINDQCEKQNEDWEESETDEAAISLVGGVVV